MRSLGYVALAAVFAVACEKEGGRSAGSPPPSPTARDAAAAPLPSAPAPQPPGPDASAPDEPAPTTPTTPTTPAPKKPKPDPKPKPEPQGSECRTDADCKVVCVRAPCPAGVCNAGRCETESVTSACATMLCKQGTQCVDDAKGARCVPMKGDKAPCQPTGCSGSVCSDRDVMTTCEMRPEYACYRDATCARQRDGACGWTQTPELAKCLEAETSSDR